MDCSKIKNILGDYIDGELDAAGMKEVKQHCAKCPECKTELESLVSYKMTMQSLPQVKAPGDFLERVHDRIDRPSLGRRLLYTLFYPLKIKLPLEAAGVLVSAVFVVILLNTVEKTDKALKIADRKAMEPIGVVEEKAPSRPAMKKSPEFKKAEAKQKPGIVMKEEGADLKQLRETITLEIAVSKDDEIASEQEKERVSFASKKSSKMNDVLKTRKKQAPFAGKGITEDKYKPEENKEYQKVEYPRSKIRNVVSSLGGRIISEKSNTMTVELPAKNYNNFFSEMDTLGRVRRHRRALGLKEADSVQIEMKLEAAK